MTRFGEKFTPKELELLESIHIDSDEEDMDVDEPFESYLTEAERDIVRDLERDIELREQIREAYIEFIEAGRILAYDRTNQDNLGVLEDARNELLTLMNNRYYVTHNPETDEYQTITPERVDRLRGMFEQGDIFMNAQFVSGSDLELVEYDIFEGEDYQNIEVLDFNYRDNRTGSYFKYTHKSPLDLTPLQILKSGCTRQEHEELNRDHCLVYAIKEYFRYNEIEHPEFDNFINQLKNKIGTNQLRTSDLGAVLPTWMCIYLVKYDDDMNKAGKVYTYFSKDNKEKKADVKCRLFLFKEHFMPSIKIKGGLDCITCPKKYDEDKDSLAVSVIRKLVKNDMLENCIYSVYKNVQIDDDVLYKYDIDTEQRVPQVRTPKPKDEMKVYADFESIVYNEKNHLPFMLGFIDDKNIYKCLTANSIEDMYKNSMFQGMLNILIKRYPDHALFKIYFHNLKYDYTLIKNNPYISIISELERSNQIYSVRLKYKNKYFSLQDSYKLIPAGLGSFASMFGLQNAAKMEFNCYNVVDRINFNKPSISVEELKQNLKRDNSEYDHKMFKPYISKKTGQYSHIRHYAEYLKMDCVTLKEGLCKFNHIISEFTGISIFNCLTISSLAFKYLQKQGCFAGVSQVTGNLQKFIMKSVTGGRVCLRYNKKVIVEDRIMDFDGVSLYPSSMVRVDFPMGNCENIQHKNIVMIMENYSQFVISCRIKINKKQQIPMISVKRDGIREWTNDIKESEVLYLDKTTLEDLLNFQKAEILEIIQGVGWKKSNGVNSKVNEVLRHLFEQRLKAKEKKNTALSNVLKLIMNSSYGKTLLTDSEYEIKYFRSLDKFESFINNNYHHIISIKKLDKAENKYTRYRAKMRKSEVGNWNYAHIGMTILSMSKRIMNEMLDIANDNDIDIYYTDTDSVHMLQSDIPKLEMLFNNKYNRELIGGNLGQFHEDFDACIKGPVWSKKFIGLGKKCYLDILTNKKGEIDHHVRFKGANRINIENFCKENNMSLEDFYIRLYNGEEIALDICNGKVRFVYTSKHVQNRKEMVKKFKF